MNDQRSKLLLQKYLNGECTPEETALVESWYNDVSGKQVDDLPEPDYKSIKNEVLNNVLQNKSGSPATVKRLWPRLAVAASLLFCMAIGAYFFATSKTNQLITLNDTRMIHAGGNKAILTLANGTQVVLTNAKNGLTIPQGATQVTKTAEGQVEYNAANNNFARQVSYNTITTPRGGQYEVLLADSTHVWLNAASSITFPTAFNGNSREVTVTGEAYFEVAHNAAKPFRVKTGNQVIEVLGTHFNVNAYADEAATKTTLLQGSVRLNGNTTLKPGEQAVNDGSSINVKPADTEEAIAWKNGKFKFSDENINILMRKIARWYDLDVTYEGNMADKDFSGSVSKFDNVAKILNVLQSTNTIHFKIEGRRITVMP